MRIGAFLATALVVVTATLSASAQSTASTGVQPWLKDRRYGEGIGIRTGNLELHPGISAELGYDSNYLQRADDEDPLAAIRLRSTGSLSLSTLGPQRRAEGGPGEPPKVNFRAGLFLTGNLLFPSGASNQADKDTITNQKNVSTGVNFTLDVLPQRPFGFDMYGDFVRTAEPSNVGSTDLIVRSRQLAPGRRRHLAARRRACSSHAWDTSSTTTSSRATGSRTSTTPSTSSSSATAGASCPAPRCCPTPRSVSSGTRDGTDIQQNAQTIKSPNRRQRPHHPQLRAPCDGRLGGELLRVGGPVPARNYDGPVAQAE